MKIQIPDHIQAIAPYVPGKPPEALKREYGISDSIKLASNENPLGPSPKAAKAMQQAICHLHRYPDGAGYDLVRQLAEKLHVKPGNLVIGNGSDEIIGMLTRALLKPGDEAIIPHPSFLMYDILVRSAGARPVLVDLKNFKIDLEAILKRISDKTRMIFICNPNNPTGTILRASNFASFIPCLPPSIVVVVDEAYIEFARDPDCLSGLDHLDGERTLVTLRTFSKAYGLAGLRVGYGIMPEPLAELLHRIRLPFNVSSLAQVAALAALEDEAFLKQSIRLVHDGLDYLTEALGKLKVKCFPTETNFFLIDVGRDAQIVFEAMLREGVIVRPMTAYGYPRYIRINVGLARENERFVRALANVLKRE
jgi:histidinol-phosphate aminotransferase